MKDKASEIRISPRRPSRTGGDPEDGRSSEPTDHARGEAASRNRAQRLLGDRYRLLERIDEGGAGEVWRARDERLERDVAVKLLGATADEAFRSRFTDEARRAATIAHPNVVTVFDEGQDSGDAYMVMEYVRGRTLRGVVAERGALVPIEAARIVSQVADALDAAHAADVIHCDVKPANVILDERGTAKLTDFGVARAARGPAEHELIATPRYIAPERIEGKPPTPASDVYGLGLVAYELLAGRPPFVGVDTDDLLRERLEGPPPSLRRVQAGVGAEVDLVVAKALQRDPARRYKSAGAFARDLLAAVRGERTQTMPVVPPAARPLRRGGRGTRPSSVIALVAVVAILAAVSLLFLRFPAVSGLPGIVPLASPAASGPATPNVIGKDVYDAVQDLLKAGYAPVGYDVSPSPGTTGACKVVTQSPQAGSPLQKGASAQVLYAPGRGCVDRLPH